jgi:hypothetical protein
VDKLQLLALEDHVEDIGELGVPVSYEKAMACKPFPYGHHEVASDLGHSDVGGSAIPMSLSSKSEFERVSVISIRECSRNVAPRYHETPSYR